MNQKQLLIITSVLLFIFPMTSFASAGKLLYGAGGGGNATGSGGATGGGGAGGILYNPAFDFSASTYTCTIGAGGAMGSNGSDTTLTGTTTAVGGGKGARDGVACSNGGSGGGDVFDQSTCTGTANQGNNGGSGSGSGNRGDGGGGRGAAGSNSDGSTGGTGGAGIADASVGDLLTHTGAGVGGFIGGGGGGGGAGNGTQGAGGSGGGGTGGGTDDATAGTANTSSGAGGNESGSTVDRSGGSGFCIFEFLTADFTYTYDGAEMTGTSGSYTWVYATTSGDLVLSVAPAPAAVPPSDQLIIFGFLKILLAKEMVYV